MKQTCSEIRNISEGERVVELVHTSSMVKPQRNRGSDVNGSPTTRNYKPLSHNLLQNSSASAPERQPHQAPLQCATLRTNSRQVHHHRNLISSTKTSCAVLASASVRPMHMRGKACIDTANRTLFSSLPPPDKLASCHCISPK